jgi:Protein kinase domain
MIRASRQLPRAVRSSCRAAVAPPSTTNIRCSHRAYSVIQYRAVQTAAAAQEQHRADSRQRFLWAAPLAAAAAAAAMTLSTADSESSKVDETSSPAKKVQLQRMITDRYRFETTEVVVGSGNRSKVITARDLRTNARVAVKQIPRYRSSDKMFQDEIQMMSLAQGHRNCVTLQDFFEDAEAYYIVMDLAEGGELFDRYLILIIFEISSFIYCTTASNSNA